MNKAIRLFKYCGYFNFPKQGLKSWTGGVKYDGFTYYPRFPDQKDPVFEPSKLLMVKRVKPFKGNAYWLKKIMVDLRLDGKLNEIIIVKNIPEMVSRLYKIKHLVKITPIRTPNGIPEAGDLESGFLKSNGEFVFSKKIVDAKRLELTEEFQTDPARLDADTLIKQSREKWNNPWN